MEGAQWAGSLGCKATGLAMVACGALIGAAAAAAKYLYQYGGRRGFSWKQLGIQAAKGALKGGLFPGFGVALGNSMRWVMLRLGKSRTTANKVASWFKAGYRGRARR